jgi:hypothetical protein
MGSIHTKKNSTTRRGFVKEGLTIACGILAGTRGGRLRIRLPLCLCRSVYYFADARNDSLPMTSCR